MKWSDRKEFYMLSTMHTAEFAKVSKKSRSNVFILKLKCAIDYNCSMGAIDKFDIVISTIDTIRKSLKWYRKYFFHLIDICMWNAFCLYKHTTTKKISMAKFHLQLIKEILRKYHKNHQFYRCGWLGSNYLVRLTGRHFPSIYYSGKKIKSEDALYVVLAVKDVNPGISMNIVMWACAFSLVLKTIIPSYAISFVIHFNFVILEYINLYESYLF